MQQSHMEPWYNVVESSGALVQCRRVKQSYCIMYYRVRQTQWPMQGGRAKYSHATLWLKSQVKPWQSVYNVVESSRAIVQSSRVKQSYVEQCSRVRWNQVEPWQCVLESSGAIIQCSTVKQSHGTIQQSQVEPRGAMLRCCRVMQINWSHGRLQYIESS